MMKSLTALASRRNGNHAPSVMLPRSRSPALASCASTNIATVQPPWTFPQHIATLGLTSLALIFHPMFKDDYDFSCEGLSRWRDGLAWQVHFRQNPQKPARMRGYRTGDQFSPVALRGRAWIATDTFQVVSLETDIVAPIPKIRLKAEHISIEYAPVRFRKNNQELWLPQNAELFFDYGGQRMHRRHHLHEYMLFSVDEKQHISPPKMDTGAAPGLPESQHNL